MILGETFGQELECDEAVEFGVLGFVDHTHAATTQLLHDAVMRDGLADHVDGSPTRGPNPTLCSKVSQTDIGGWAYEGKVSVSVDPGSLAGSVFSSCGPDVHDS